MTATARRAPSAAILGATLVLTSLNLRAAVTSVGALLRDIQVDLAMTDTVAGVLTTLPVLAFGVFGLLAARLARRIGTSRALVLALVIMAVGLAARALSPSQVWLLALTVITLAGMAIGNVLVPVAVKAWFPDSVGRVTGYYSVAILLGTSIPAAASVPLAEALGGWRAGVGWWALPAAVALLPWLAVRWSTPAGTPMIADRVIASAENARHATGAAELGRRVRRRPQSWALMVFFGIQSTEAYVAMGWFATILQDAGVSASRAGWLLAVAMGLSAPLALIVPRMAGRRPDQRAWVVVLTAASVVAYVGLLIAPGAAPLVWAVFLGVGLGAFPLALLMIGLRARTSAGTGALSSLTQGYGYLLAATGPFAVGALHDATGTWNVPLAVLLGLLVPKLFAGLIVGRPGFVDDPPAAATM
ncbi:MAG: MFS transporter [Nitriliruptoraceae bacterium]